MKALSFFFQNLKRNWKNPVSIKGCGFLKMVFTFWLFSQKNAAVSKIMGTCEIIGIFFEKPYHRDMGNGQKWRPPHRTYTDTICVLLVVDLTHTETGKQCDSQLGN